MFVRNLAAFALFCLFITVSGQVHAQTAGQPQAAPSGKVGILDVQRILRDAAAMKSVRSQVRTLRDTFRSELQDREKALRDANQELTRKRALLAPEAFEAERRTFEQQVAEVQRLIQERNQQVDKASAEAVLEVQKSYNAIVAELAQERGLGIVFRRQSLVLATPQLDITPDVLARLDQRLPSVQVNPPAN